jgi:hypothetical protein
MDYKLRMFHYQHFSKLEMKVGRLFCFLHMLCGSDWPCTFFHAKCSKFNSELNFHKFYSPFLNIGIMHVYKFFMHC